MSNRYLIASFDDETHVLEASRELRERGFSIADAFLPYPIHGLETAAGFGPTRLGWVCAIGGFIGATSMLFFQWWTSAVDWTLNVGGKPFNSLPAFIPAVFEIGVLFAALGTVLAFFIVSRLYPGKEPDLPTIEVTNDRFVLLLEQKDAQFDRSEVEEICKRHSVIEVREPSGTGGRA